MPTDCSRAGTGPSGRHGDRPYTIANFVTSADGATAVKGRSAALGDDGDRAIFHALRGQVDAVLAGTNTLQERALWTDRAECRAPCRTGRGRPPGRAARLRHQPQRAVLPLEIPLFAEPEAEIVVFSPIQPDLTGTRAQVEVVRTDPGASHPLSAALSTLRTDFGVATLLCEGGPTLFGSLLSEGLIDELFLTLAPKLAGGDSGPPLNSGPPLGELQELRIEWLLTRRESLFLRYARNRRPVP